MTKKRNQHKIYHTSSATVDHDQKEALEAAPKIFGNSGPKPLPSPIRKPNPRRKK
jgi:hypothetical protein